MLILRLWNYFRGYVIIKVEGLSLERFINMCITRGIYLWDIRRVNYTTLEAKVGIKGFKEIRKVVRKAGCKVYISKKNGYPFFAHQFKKRKMLLMGAFFSFLILIFSSTFILRIDVVGNKQIDEEVIRGALRESGLKLGANRYFVDLREIENQLLMDIHEIAWVGIHISGIQAKIEVVEKVLPPGKIEKSIPCDVVARKNGVIEKVLAKNGQATVKKGDIVAEGDVLITGNVVKEMTEEVSQVHAYGEVYARTYYEAAKSIELTQIRREKTGESTSKTTVGIGQLRISLNRDEIPYPVYIYEQKVFSPLQWRGKGLPVQMMVEYYHEAVETKETIEVEEAKKTIHEISITELMEQIPLEAEILNTNVDFQVKDDVLYGKVIIEVLEEIGEQRRL